MKKNTSQTIATVCYPIREKFGKEEIMLARKVRKVGTGRWNGFGGKKEKCDFSIEVTAVRELLEESGLATKPSQLEKVAVILFKNANYGEWLVYFFFARNCVGEAKPTDQMTDPTWFPKQNIPYSEMQEADRIFLPIVLSGKKITGTVEYDKKDRLVSQKLKVVKKFD